MPSSAAKKFKPTDISNSPAKIYSRPWHRGGGNTDVDNSGPGSGVVEGGGKGWAGLENCRNDGDDDEEEGKGKWREWVPGLETRVGFGEEVFWKVMIDMISNPNYNSSLVMRADVLWDSDTIDHGDHDNSEKSSYCGNIASFVTREGEKEDKEEQKEDTTPRYLEVKGYRLTRRLVRRFVPRNPGLDGYLCQSCLFYEEEDEEKQGDSGGSSLVIYLPHASHPTDIPFYHPAVEGIAFLHQPAVTKSEEEEEKEAKLTITNNNINSASHLSHNTSTSPSKTFTISIHYLPFLASPESLIPPQTSHPPISPLAAPITAPSTAPSPKSTNPNRLPRILHHLLSTLTTHGKGLLEGYTKRVHHDQLIPRSTLQDTYLRLKQTHAKRLVENWVESTDPGKHVFEDLLIAAFLIEWWRKVYVFPGEEDGEKKGNKEEEGDIRGGNTRETKRPWIGFVDIGCGNGILVEILRREGFSGWGFDARKRKTWEVLQKLQQEQPQPHSQLHEVQQEQDPWLKEMLLIPSLLSSSSSTTPLPPTIPIPTHNGLFPPHTFLISNHSDQLTGWTPLLAAASNCPFIAIPCCSYNLSGEKVRFHSGHYEEEENENENENTQEKSKDKGKKKKKNNSSSNSGSNSSSSAYAGLCSWTETLSKKVGWVVEKEVLRIPSTRNMAILGRNLVVHPPPPPNEGESEGENDQVNQRIQNVLKEEGGGVGWIEKCIGGLLGKGAGGKGCH